MSENTVITINNVRLSSGMTVDYEKGDSVINSVFKRFDTNIDKTIDDDEWKKVVEYNEKLQKRKQEIAELEKNNKVISHYEKKAIKLQKQSETLLKQINEIPNEFSKLLDFEEKHPQVCREGVIDKKDIPENGFQYNLSSFEMGIPDKDEKSYTGECYKLGYIKGFETLTEAEQKEYKQLLDNATKYIKKTKSLMEKAEELGLKVDKYLGLKDMAKNGIIKKVGSAEYENQMYQKYIQIRNEANPFLPQIREFEQKYNELFRKFNKTDDENKLLAQYRTQILKLTEASENWSISDLPEDKKVQAFGHDFNVTDASEQFTYNNEGKDEKYTNTHSIGLQYNDENFSVQGNFEQAQIYKPGEKTENTFNTSLSGKYSKGNYSLSSNTSLSTDNFSSNFSQTFGANYKNLGIDYTKSFMTTKAGEEGGETTTSTSDKIGISYTAGKFNNNASVTFAPEGTNYTLGTNTNFNQQLGENLDINIMPSANVYYNNQNETYTIDPSLTVMANYNNNNFNANMMLMESYSSTLSNGAKPQNTNMFMANGGVSFKGFGTNLKYTNIDTPFNNSNTYGAEIYYNNPKAGRLVVEYNYQKSTMKMTEISPIETSMLIAKYTLPLETINSWLKK